MKFSRQLELMNMEPILSIGYDEKKNEEKTTTQFKCMLCDSAAPIGEKIIHSEFCPVMIARREEEEEREERDRFHEAYGMEARFPGDN